MNIWCFGLVVPVLFSIFTINAQAKAAKKKIYKKIESQARVIRKMA